MMRSALSWLLAVAFVSAIGVAPLWAADAKDSPKSNSEAVEKPKTEAADKPAAPQGPPPALIRTAAVKKETLNSRWEVVGRLREARRTTVASEQSGKIIEIVTDEGDAVAAGKTIARIDPTWMNLDLLTADAELKQGQAEVSEAQALLKQSQSDLKYLEDLLKRDVAKSKEVEDKRSQAAAYQARLERANAVVVATQARITRVKEQLARLEVKAPFAGVVVKKLAEIGQWASPGSPIAEIVSTGKIEAVVDVPERLVNLIKPGQTMDLSIESLHENVSGVVSAIVPEGDNAARTFPVKITLDDGAGKLKPGMSVTASVPTTDKVEVLTVPRDAVQRTAAGTVVWVNANGAAAQHGVEILFGSGDRYAVKPIDAGGGAVLNESMSVVIEGAERLFPGAPLMDVGAPKPEPRASR